MRASDDEIMAWADRNDFMGTLTASRAAFEDAVTLHNQKRNDSVDWLKEVDAIVMRRSKTMRRFFILIFRLIRWYMWHWKCTYFGHDWKSTGGRPCPKENEDCGQPVYECSRCHESDYGDKGGPAHHECFEICNWKPIDSDA